MARSLLAMIALAAFGLFLLVPDDASARAGAVRGARSVGGFHHGGAGAFVRRPGMHHRGAVWRGGDRPGGAGPGGCAGAAAAPPRSARRTTAVVKASTGPLDSVMPAATRTACRSTTFTAGAYVLSRCVLGIQARGLRLPRQRSAG